MNYMKKELGIEDPVLLVREHAIELCLQIFVCHL